jgi:serine/threonine protein kinase
MKVIETFEDKKHFFVVTELFEGGELFDKITEKEYFSEKEAAKTMKQILSAVNYCHKNNITHR